MSALARLAAPAVAARNSAAFRTTGTSAFRTAGCCRPRAQYRSFVVRAADEKPKGHQVGKDSTMSMDNIDPEVLALRDHQQSAARLSFADECRTLVDAGRYAVISTNSREFEGFPAGSVVGFASDDEGRPVFVFSSMSGHTQDIKADGRVSLTVTQLGFKGAADARVMLTGTVSSVPDEEKAAVRDAYLAKHPDAFWVDFGDFTWHRMDDIKGCRIVGGFARAGSVSPEEYAAAGPDPVAGFSAPIAGHMNADHEDSLLAMTKHFVGITVSKAAILSLDSLGMNMQVTRGEETFKIRLPFEEPALDRKAVKDVMVGMTRAAAAAAAKDEAGAEAEAEAEPAKAE